MADILGLSEEPTVLAIALLRAILNTFSNFYLSKNHSLTEFSDSSGFSLQPSFIPVSYRILGFLKGCYED